MHLHTSHVSAPHSRRNGADLRAGAPGHALQGLSSPTSVLCSPAGQWQRLSCGSKTGLPGILLSAGTEMRMGVKAHWSLVLPLLAVQMFCVHSAQASSGNRSGKGRFHTVPLKGTTWKPLRKSVCWACHHPLQTREYCNTSIYGR